MARYTWLNSLRPVPKFSEPIQPPVSGEFVGSEFYLKSKAAKSIMFRKRAGLVW